MLARPDLRQLRQRIVLRHHLRPFDEKETAAYVEERMRLAGYTGPGAFDRGALREVHEVTGGIPRLLNIVCDGALLLGFSRDLPVIGRAQVREVAQDLELPAVAGIAPGAAEAAGDPGRRRRGILGLFR
jgi:general secretion pathway protein A